MNVQLLYHLRHQVHLPENVIGILLAVSALGAIAASFIYPKLQNALSLKQLLYLGVILAVIGRLSYLLLGSNAIVAGCIWLFNGSLSMIILIPCLALAAKRCPEGLEAFGYGLMTCFLTLSRIAGNTVGAWLYEYTFNHNLTFLVLLSAFLAAIAIPFLAMLKLDDGPAMKS